MIYWWFVVILVTSLATFWVANLVMRPKRSPLERTTLLARLEEGIGRTELPRAGRFDADWWPNPEVPPASASYGLYRPFPDTGPLLILSEQAAANVALEREIRQRCAEAEAKIPPRWR